MPSSFFIVYIYVRSPKHYTHALNSCVLHLMKLMRKQMRAGRVYSSAHRVTVYYST